MARLLDLARREWANLDGQLAVQRVDPLLLPPDRFFNTVYWWAIKDAAEQADIDRFNRRLWRPPKGKAAPAGTPWSAEAETASFKTFAAEFASM